MKKPKQPTSMIRQFTGAYWLSCFFCAAFFALFVMEFANFLLFIRSGRICSSIVVLQQETQKKHSWQ